MPKRHCEKLDRELLKAELDRGHKRDHQIKAFLEKKFPGCEWEVYIGHATGKFEDHRSNWEIKVTENWGDAWEVSLIVKNIDVVFNAASGKTLEEAVTNLKKRLQQISEQFAQLAA